MFGKIRAAMQAEMEAAMNGNQGMTARRATATTGLAVLAASALVFGSSAFAQVPVDENGNPIGSGVSPLDGVDIENPMLNSADDLSVTDLETLIGPIALYPDDLLAVVLPASTYPLEIVQAARFLERLESNPSIEPDEAWDDSIVALLNYPDVLNMMNDDLDWTWQLGDAVVRQQADVILAIESFRDRAYAAGNLQSDDHQRVSRSDEGVIEIEPVQEDVIYVPYYEPERVVYYSPTPVYHYYPRAYPVYYYPYPRGHYFASSLFWGVTTAFTIGWATDHLHTYHHSYYGHPFYGRPYHFYGSYWRRPSINIYNSWYVDRRSPHYQYRHKRGDYWRPRHRRSGARPATRVVQKRYDQDRRNDRHTDGRRRSGSDYYADGRQSNRADFNNRVRRPAVRSEEDRREQRERRRDNTITAGRQDQVRSTYGNRATEERRGGNEDTIRFRPRGSDARTPERSTRLAGRNAAEPRVSDRNRGSAGASARRNPPVSRAAPSPDARSAPRVDRRPSSVNRPAQRSAAKPAAPRRSSYTASSRPRAQPAQPRSTTARPATRSSQASGPAPRRALPAPSRSSAPVRAGRSSRPAADRSSAPRGAAINRGSRSGANRGTSRPRGTIRQRNRN